MRFLENKKNSYKLPDEKTQAVAVTAMFMAHHNGTPVARALAPDDPTSEKLLYGDIHVHIINGISKIAEGFGPLD